MYKQTLSLVCVATTHYNHISCHASLYVETVWSQKLELCRTIGYSVVSCGW